MCASFLVAPFRQVCNFPRVPSSLNSPFVPPVPHVPFITRYSEIPAKPPTHITRSEAERTVLLPEINRHALGTTMLLAGSTVLLTNLNRFINYPPVLVTASTLLLVRSNR